MFDLDDVRVFDLDDVRVLDLHKKNAVWRVTNRLKSPSSRALCLVSQGSETPHKKVRDLADKASQSGVQPADSGGLKRRSPER